MKLISLNLLDNIRIKIETLNRRCERECFWIYFEIPTEEIMGRDDLWAPNVREFLTNGGNYPI